MKLDQKYFIPFLAVVAVLTALLITFFTISSQKSQRNAFRRAIVIQDSLRYERMSALDGGDSVAVRDFSGKYVVLDFWATWSNYSDEVHRELAEIKQEYPDKMEVIAAVVQDQPEKINTYRESHKYPFQFVDGTRIFNKYGVPGMPVELIYNPQGKIEKVFFGFSGPAHFDSLKVLLENAEQ